MAEVKQRIISETEAYRLAERLANYDSPNYLIREALIEKGLSAQSAMRIISEMRHAQVHDYGKETINLLQFVLVAVLLVVIALIFFVLISPVY